MVVVVVVVMMPVSEVSLLSVAATADALPPPVLALLSCPWVLVLVSPGFFALRVMVVLLSPLVLLSVRWLLYLVMSRAVVLLAALLNLPLAVTVVLVNLVIVYLVMIRVVNLVLGVVEVL